MQFATYDEIKKGLVSDVYFDRTYKILEALNINKKVAMELTLKRFPNNYPWGIFTGVEECVALLSDLSVDVWSLSEGSLFHANQPLMVLEGFYRDFGIYETALLGLLCQASGIATKAARCRKLVDDKILVSFGARRMHPMIERNAYIGGCDGVAVIKSAETLGIEPTGTIPHALILIIGDTVKACQAFNEIIDKDVKRVALIDTFHDEKFEALNVAEALKEDLFAVRLDTPASRRGDFYSILKEVRWELDLRGYQHVKLFVSGGIDENNIIELNEVVDAYGIGTAISNAPVLDFSLDIVEIEGTPIAKRGKTSGRKDLLRCPNCYKTQVVPHNTKITPFCDCNLTYQNLLKPVLKKGKITEQTPPKKVRDYVIEQLNSLP